jgi:hypothetical protein
VLQVRKVYKEIPDLKEPVDHKEVKEIQEILGLKVLV